MQRPLLAPGQSVQGPIAAAAPTSGGPAEPPAGTVAPSASADGTAATALTVVPDAPSAPQPDARVKSEPTAAAEPNLQASVVAPSADAAAAEGGGGEAVACTTLGQLLRRMLRLLSRPDEVSPVQYQKRVSCSAMA